jgi:hypothetical protein
MVTAPPCLPVAVSRDYVAYADTEVVQISGKNSTDVQIRARHNTVRRYTAREGAYGSSSSSSRGRGRGRGAGDAHDTNYDYNQHQHQHQHHHGDDDDSYNRASSDYSTGDAGISFTYTYDAQQICTNYNTATTRTHYSTSPCTDNSTALPITYTPLRLLLPPSAPPSIARDTLTTALGALAPTHTWGGAAGAITDASDVNADVGPSYTFSPALSQPLAATASLLSSSSSLIAATARASASSLLDTASSVFRAVESARAVSDHVSSAYLPVDLAVGAMSAVFNGLARDLLGNRPRVPHAAPGPAPGIFTADTAAYLATLSSSLAASVKHAYATTASWAVSLTLPSTYVAPDALSAGLLGYAHMRRVALATAWSVSRRSNFAPRTTVMPSWSTTTAAPPTHSPPRVMATVL